MKPIPVVLITLLVAVPATWFAARKFQRAESSPGTAAALGAGATERRPLFYQSAMHPWIKSDKPGRCTICGMELTPVYEGDGGSAGLSGDVVPLTQSMIQVMNVQTAEVESRPLEKTLLTAGVIDDNATRHRVLSAYVAGRIEKLYVNYMGAEVEAGQPLAEFYSPALLQAEREYRTLTGELRAATALRLRQMGLTVAQIEAIPQKPADALTSQILAPIGGTVVSQSVFEGQYVMEGERLFEIADFSTMWFQFRAYEQDLPWIKPGLKVDVTTPAHPGRTFTGPITFIDPNFQEATRSTKVRVELDNPAHEGRRPLLHRLYADGRIHLEAPVVLAVPRTAVLETGPQAVAYVDLGGGAYSRRVLELGRRGDAFVEVKSGLSAGERVVVQGNLLIDGQAEINRAFAEPVAAAPDARTTTAAPAAEPAYPELTGAQRDVLKAFVELAHGLGDALAADDLEAFNTRAAQTHLLTPAVVTAFDAGSPWRSLLDPFESSGHLSAAADLKSARRAFHPFSQSSVALVQALRRQASGFEALKVFRCPMTAESFPGAPRRAEWIQLQAPIRNPYFGAEMLDCGSEVKP